jgi:hypothetical protein
LSPSVLKLTALNYISSAFGIFGSLEGTYVDELEVEPADHFRARVIETINYENVPKYPKNYKTCNNFILLLWNMAEVLFGMCII